MASLATDKSDTTEKENKFISGCQNGDLELAKKLLAEGVNVNAKDKYGYTALMWAARDGRKETLELLLEQENIDINAKNNDENGNGMTALMWAACGYWKETLELLLKQENIDINAKNDGGNTALMIALYNEEDDNVELLLKQESIDITLHFAARWGDEEIVELLLKQENIDINEKDDGGGTALITAAYLGFKDIVELLLKQDNIDVNARNDASMTALLWAAHKGNNEIVELLLKHENIDINLKDNNGETALMLAESDFYYRDKCHKDIVKLLQSAEKMSSLFHKATVLYEKAARVEQAKKTPPSPAKLQQKKTYYIGIAEEEKNFRLRNAYEEDDVEEMVTTLANVSDDDEEIKTRKQGNKEKSIVPQGVCFLLNKKQFQGGDRTTFLTHASNLGKTKVEKKIIMYRFIVLENARFDFQDWEVVKQNIRICIGDNEENKIFCGEETKAALQKIMTDFEFDNAATMMEELKQEKKRKPSLDEDIPSFLEGEENELAGDFPFNDIENDAAVGAGMLSVSTPEAPTPSKANAFEKDYGEVSEDMLTDVVSLSDKMSSVSVSVDSFDKAAAVIADNSKKKSLTCKKRTRTQNPTPSDGKIDERNDTRGQELGLHLHLKAEIDSLKSEVNSLIYQLSEKQFEKDTVHQNAKKHYDHVIRRMENDLKTLNDNIDKKEEIMNKKVEQVENRSKQINYDLQLRNF